MFFSSSIKTTRKKEGRTGIDEARKVTKKKKKKKESFFAHCPEEIQAPSPSRLSPATIEPGTRNVVSHLSNGDDATAMMLFNGQEERARASHTLEY
jgi:hypothetical protein